MTKVIYIRYCFIMITMCAAFFTKAQTVVLHFPVQVNGKTLAADSSYTNAHGESYTVTRLKFYISNISLDDKKSNAVYLVDAFSADSVVLQLPKGEYHTIRFTLGIDSILNCSGAQDGALDPLNGMFWTWNSGYIFFKMEGYSPASAADLHRIEHHIGGYRSPYNAAKQLSFTLPGKLAVSDDHTAHIYIQANLDQYWKSPNGELKIADNALVMVPGEFAVKAVGQFKEIFSVTGIRSN
ncbi:MAG: hypothetical protein QM687_04225 [Ferruginibacter sp.]